MQRRTSRRAGNNYERGNTMEKMTYKGLPLVRCGNDMYYGFMNEPYVIMLQAGKQKDVGGIAVSQNVQFYLISTDEKLNPIEATKKHGERDTLLDALNVGYTWLERESK